MEGRGRGTIRDSTREIDGEAEKSRKSLSHDSCSQGQDLKPESDKHEVGIQHLLLRHWIPLVTHVAQLIAMLDI
jgi:hypothetical protein